MSPFRLLILLVALDLVSKLAALTLLSKQDFVRLDALFQFALQTNETGLGTWAKASGLLAPDAFAGTIGYIGLAWAFIATRRRLTLWRRSALAIAAFIISAILALPAAEALMNVSQPLWIAAFRIAPMTLTATIWWVVPVGLFKLGLTLLLAAGIGNFLSLLYPPFRIVDFMYSRVTARLFHYGVFNVADLYIPVGLACLPVGALQYLMRRVRRPRRPTGPPVIET